MQHTPTLHTYCRLCEGACGLLAATDGGLTALSPDREDPVSGGYICETAERSLDAIAHPERITTPLRRDGDRLVPVSWEDAIAGAGAALREVRGQTGPGSIGLYIGDEVFRSSQDWIRALAFGIGTGTPAVLSDLCMGAGPRLRLTELMMGHPAMLIPDVGRAHSVVLLGGEPLREGWGPLAAGGDFLPEVEHSRKTKGTRVVVADPRRTALADQMDQHLAVRPGTEPFLLLGMLSAIVGGDWHDAQYIRDYTTGYEALEEAIRPWSPARCAEICGISTAALSGVALKFSRAPMGVVSPGFAAFSNANSALGAWAWLALHTVTANTLRPGGIYENPGLIDIQPLLSTIPTADAPRTRTGHPLMLLQAPGTALSEEILTPGEGQLRALITLSADPAGRLPGQPRVHEALDALAVRVHIGRVMDDTARRADWILPALHPWERADITLHSASLLPMTGLLATPPLVAPRGDARAISDILPALFAAMRPGLRGSAWGHHLGLLARYLLKTDLDAWESRALDWAGGIDRTQLNEPPHRIVRSATDRALWRPSTPDERIHLMPEGIQDILARIAPPSAPLLLRTSARPDRAPDAHHRAPQPAVAWLHPDTGVGDGQTVRVTTRHGSITITARHDLTLRPDTVDISAISVPEALGLLAANRVDPITGAAELDGVGCTVETP